MATNTDITTMHSIAKHYGGKCLSKEYIDVRSPLQWMCEKGHRWESGYRIVSQGGWCRICAVLSDRGTKLEEIKKIALNHGGKCLTDEYINNSSLMKFVCKNGHTWENSAQLIKKGSWCNVCSTEKLKKENFEQVMKIVLEKEGKCLSSEYINNVTKLEFECKKGHTFFVSPANIKSGGWCHFCAVDKSRDSIEMFHEIARKNGGKCLSAEYKNSKEKLEFECDKGHVWKNSGDSVKNGIWCTKCSYKQAGINKRGSDEPSRKIAIQHGGKLLSTEYIGRQIFLNLECAEGHIWRADRNNVLNGSWCRICFAKIRGVSLRNPIEKYHRIAISHGGKCLSTENKGNKTKLDFECANGHIFKMVGNSVTSGTWCPKCANLKKGDTLRDSINTYINIAAEKGGKCLTAEYKNGNSRIKMQCANGHVWTTMAAGLKHGTWCPICSYKISTDKLRDSIDTFYKIAAANNGECLSTEYTTNTTRLQFKCSHAHIWTTEASKIKSGKWCPKCNAKKQGRPTNGSIKMFQEIAAAKGGKCLSNEYVNAKTKLEFECKAGHRWITKAGTIKKGSWCQQCFAKTKGDSTRGNLKTYIEIANAKGGKCLSDKYINLVTNLEFECANGHIWKTAPYSIKRGVWCKICKKAERKKAD